jgi:tetratricopeptide (TPR) repeat protein
VLLEDCGDEAGAEAAYKRADEAGFAGGAYGLGQMLYAKGDIVGSIEANRRADQLGDADGAYNLGVLLQQSNDLRGAEEAFMRADDRGHGGAASAVGRILEKRGDTAGAEAAYRRAEDRGDPNGSYGLGTVLYARGDREGALEAFGRAADQGHAGAPEILDLLQKESRSDGGDSNELTEEDLTSAYEAYSAVQRTILSQRRTLLSALEGSKAAVAGVQAKIDLIRLTAQRLGEEQRTLLKNNSNYFSYAPRSPRGQPDETIVRASDRLGTVALRSGFEGELRDYLERARQLLYEANRRRFASRLRTEATELLDSFQTGLADLEATAKWLEGERDKLGRTKKAEIQGLRGDADQRLAASLDRARTLSPLLPAPMQPWTASHWQGWRPGVHSDVLFAGYLVPNPDESLSENADFGTSTHIPVYFPTRGRGFHLVYSNALRDKTVRLARSLLTRILTAVEPGKAQFHIFDPVGLGQSVANILELGEFDSELIGGKIWSSSSDLSAMLTAQTAHIELVIQKYLRNNFDSIDEFNVEAGEIAEPYRYLTIFDFPSGFSEDSYASLSRIVGTGPRCGVYTLLFTNGDVAQPPWLNMGGLSQGQFKVTMSAPFIAEDSGYRMQMSFRADSDSDIPLATMQALIEQVGRSANESEDVAVGFGKTMDLFFEAAARGVRPGLPSLPTFMDAEDPRTWWPCDSIGGICAPLGQSGARDVAVLGFDSSDHSGALLVGRPGSGKSTLLHTFLAGVTTLYGPEELELYLIDFKEGVEFKSYATAALPHAKCVAVETDREFGLSVLRALDAEIDRRGQLLRSSGGQHSGLESLRRATSEKLPRILLVFDEFHVLFSQNDKIGIEAASLLESVIRQGRGFGIHAILGSQSLAGLDALGSHVPQLLPVRILLPAAEADARRVLGEDNDAGKYLSHRGEAVLNASAGRVEANEPFRVAFLDEQARVSRLRQLRGLADSRGFLRRPIVFEGNALAPLSDTDPRIFAEELATTSASGMVKLRLATPMALFGTADIALRREAGANLLIVARDTVAQEALPVAVTGAAGLVRSLFSSIIASARCSNARLEIVDFMPADEGIGDQLDPLLDGANIQIRRRRELPEMMKKFRAEVSERLDEDAKPREPMLLALYGLHRARDFDPDAIDFDASEGLADSLTQILRDGPEVGVHVIVWSESVTGTGRRLAPSAMREFSWRVAGRMSSDDAQSLIDSSEAATLREHQVLVTNDDLGIFRRCTAFGLPSKEWIEALTDCLRRS